MRESVLVIDANTGQNGLQQAKVFKDCVNLTAVALTKLDGSAKGAIVLAIAKDLGLPVKLVGVGEKSAEVMRTIDKIEKIGEEKVKKLLVEETGLSEDAADKILALITCQEKGIAPLDALAEYAGQCQRTVCPLDPQSRIPEAKRAFGAPKRKASRNSWRLS